MPAQQINFTKTALSELPPAPSGKRVYFRDKRYPQLYLQITDRGSKSFQIYAWGAGRPQRVTLGKFEPNNHASLTIDQARRKVAPILKKVQGGRIPTAEKRQRRQAETVKDLCDEYLERHAKVKKKSWKEDERQINKDILPQWRNRKVREITRRDVNKLIDRIADRGAEIQARRTYRLISRMFSYAMGKGIVEASPCVAIELPGKENRRTRSLSADEIKSFWPKLAPESEDLSMSPSMRLLLRLVLATGQRPGECRELKWAEIDEPWWTIPAEKRKRTEDSETGEHRVYLNDHALAVLDDAKKLSDGWKNVFPSPRGDQPMRKDALSHAVKNNLKILGLDDFQAKDLRRTASTHMAEAGVPDPDIRRVQGHALAGMGRVYNVYHYDKEKQRALETWDRRLREILTGKKRGKVVPLARRR